MSTPNDSSQTDKLLTTTRAARKRLDRARQVSRGSRRPAEEITYWNGWKGVRP